MNILVRLFLCVAIIALLESTNLETLDKAILYILFVVIIQVHSIADRKRQADAWRSRYQRRRSDNGRN